MSTVEGWTIKPLSEIADITMGQSPDSKYYTEEEKGLPFIQGCAEFNARFPKAKLYCTQIKKIAPKSSILFSVRAPVGRINIANQAYIIGRGLAAISGKNVNQDFLEKYIAHQEPFFRVASQGSTFEAINTSELNKWQIHFPNNCAEQTKIAEILSCIDTAIEQTEAMIAKQQRIKTGLMQDLLSKGIDEHGNIRTEQTHAFKDSELGRIPVGWEVGGFENYVVSNAGIKSGPFGSSITKDMYVEQGYRVYGQEQVIGGTLDIGDYFITARKFKEMETYSIDSGDVLISLMGTIGYVLIVPEIYHSGVINPRLLRFRPNMKCCLPEFLKALLLSDPVRLQLEKFALGVTMQGLSAGIIKKVSVVLIEIDEQKRIFEVLATSEKHISSLFESLAKLKRQKTALMQDLLSGNVRVNGLI